MQSQSIHKFGVFTAALIGMNAMIGAGIFTTPAKLATAVGPAAIITYLFVIFAVWCMAQSFGRLSELYPGAGSFWQYTKPWAGDTVGRIASWSYIIGLSVAMGLVAKYAGIYLHEYVPSLTPSILTVLVLAAIGVLQFIGGAAVAASQYISICCTAFPIIAIAGLCLTKASIANFTPFAPFGLGAVLSAIPAVIFGFMGFESITTLSEVVHDPKHTLPRALNFAVLGVGLIYIFFIGSIFSAIPASTFASASVPLSEPLNQLFPNYTWLVNLIHASMTIAFISVVNAVTFGLSRLISSLRKPMQTGYAKLDQWLPTFDALALIFLAAWLLKTPDLFFAIASMLLMIPFLTSFITLLTLPRERTVITYITCATTIIVFCSAMYNVIWQLQ